MAVQKLVKVRSHVGTDWPHGRILIVQGATEMTFTPNQARRLVLYLEQAIPKAEWRE